MKMNKGAHQELCDTVNLNQLCMSQGQDTKGNVVFFDVLNVTNTLSENNQRPGNSNSELHFSANNVFIS